MRTWNRTCCHLTHISGTIDSLNWWKPFQHMCLMSSFNWNKCSPESDCWLFITSNDLKSKSHYLPVHVWAAAKHSESLFILCPCLLLFGNCSSASIMSNTMSWRMWESVVGDPGYSAVILFHITEEIQGFLVTYL